jgi:uncharacterized membrane protein YeiH
MTMDWMLVMDLLGTAAFALSGAFKAVKYELDILGVLVLAAATAVGGGILRDSILGIHPPMVFQFEYYIIICLVAGLVVFFASSHLAQRWDYIMLADALGLGIFTAIGCQKGADAGLGFLGIIFIGTLTACGGGVIRDILVREVPGVLNTDFYATAAIFGGIFFHVLTLANVEPRTIAFFVFILVAVLRILAMRFKFKLPVVRSMKRSPSQAVALKHKRNTRKVK